MTMQMRTIIDGRALAAPGPVTRQLQEIWAARAADGLDP